jgi:hypothetical protein
MNEEFLKQERPNNRHMQKLPMAFAEKEFEETQENHRL